jgi:hypothetical protein
MVRTAVFVLSAACLAVVGLALVQIAAQITDFARRAPPALSVPGVESELFYAYVLDPVAVVFLAALAVAGVTGLVWVVRRG